MIPGIADENVNFLHLENVEENQQIRLTRKDEFIDFKFEFQQAQDILKFKCVFDLERDTVLTADFSTHELKQENYRGLTNLMLDIVDEGEYEVVRQEFFIDTKEVQEVKKTKNYTPKKLFSEEDIQYANSVSIIDLAHKYNLELKKKGNEYHVDGQGGLVISDDGSKFNNFSKGVGGSAIQFVMAMENVSWKDAVKEILGNDFKPVNLFATGEQVNRDSNTQFMLPESNENYKRMYAYLLKTRGLNKEVVQNFVDKKMLYQDKKGNCVFVGYDEKNEAKYGSLRGTLTDKQFRGDVKGSNKAVPFALKNNNKLLHIFESPIDMMSYLSIMKNREIDHSNRDFVSTGGTNITPIETVIKSNDKLETLIVCVDNDEAGKNFANRISQQFGNKYKVVNHFPHNKDYNLDLIEMNNKNEINKTPEVVQEIEEEITL